MPLMNLHYDSVSCQQRDDMITKVLAALNAQGILAVAWDSAEWPDFVITPAGLPN